MIAGLGAGYWVVNLYFEGSKKKEPSSDESSRKEDDSYSSKQGNEDGEKPSGEQNHEMNSEPGWWIVLGVPIDAPDSVVRSTHKRLVSLCHPDRVSHLSRDMQKLATQQTKELNSALARYELATKKK